MSQDSELPIDDFEIGIQVLQTRVKMAMMLRLKGVEIAGH